MSRILFQMDLASPNGSKMSFAYSSKSKCIWAFSKCYSHRLLALEGAEILCLLTCCNIHDKTRTFLPEYCMLQKEPGVGCFHSINARLPLYLIYLSSKLSTGRELLWFQKRASQVTIFQSHRTVQNKDVKEKNTHLSLVIILNELSYKTQWKVEESHDSQACAAS